MLRSDRDILFGDRFGGLGGGPGAGPGDSGAWSLDDAEVDALMDAYFDGDITDDDRVRLFELLRRDPDRCLQFVEMQRTTLLLERSPAGPDQTDSILARIRRQRPPQRIGPRVTRFALAAAVALAGAGLVIVGQSGPPGSSRRAAPTLPIAANPGADSPATAAEAGAPRVAETPARPSLRPGALRSTRTGLFSDPGQPQTRIRGLAEVSPGFPGGYAGAPPLISDPASLLSPGGAPEPFSASPSDIRRLIGFAYGGRTPWGIIGAWPVPDDSWATPGPAPAPAVLEP